MPVPSLFASLQPSFYHLLVPQPFGVLFVVVLPSDIQEFEEDFELMMVLLVLWDKH